MKSPKLQEIETQILSLDAAERAALREWVSLLPPKSDHAPDLSGFAGTVNFGTDGLRFQIEVRNDWS